MIFKSDTPTLSKAIYSWINEAFKRSGPTNVNRASAAPGCVRKRWFQAHNYAEAEEPNERMQLVFLFGGLVEHTMLYFIEQALVGPGKAYSELDLGSLAGQIPWQGKLINLYNQKTLTVNIDGIPVTCHLDGRGKRASDGVWENIEIKSSSNFGFDRFERGDDFDYLKQIHVQMKATGATETRVFYMRKETSHLWDRLYSFDDKVWAEVVTDYGAAVGSEMPPNPFPPTDEVFRKKPTGRKKIDWHCAYCGFREHCYDNLELVIKNGKPTYYVKDGLK